MIEWIVILLIIFCIIVLHYSQSSKQYSLSQIKESQIPASLLTLWEEKNPIVITDTRTTGIWVADALQQTRFWGAQPIWQDYQASPLSPMRTERNLQITWSDILGVTQIESDILLRWFDLNSLIFSTRTECHIGYDGLRQTFGWATAITCTDGEMRCILLNSSQKSKMPGGWKGLRWSDATVANHPLWTQVKNIEVILRPGSVLLIPPHWLVAIEPKNPAEPFWWTRTDIHHFISGWAQKLNER